MFDHMPRETVHRQLALDVLETGERELIEQFLRCERFEAIEFLQAAAKIYEVRREYHRAEAQLYATAAAKLARLVARLGGPRTATGLTRRIIARTIEAGHALTHPQGPSGAPADPRAHGPSDDEPA